MNLKTKTPPPVCNRCGETDPSKFYCNKRRASGFRAYCKTCENKSAKSEVQRARHNAAARRWYDRNKHKRQKANPKVKARLRGVVATAHVGSFTPFIPATPSGVTARGETDDEMIARFIRERGVTKLPEVK